MINKSPLLRWSAVLGLCFSIGSQGATWNGSQNNYFTNAANWAGNLFPANGEAVVIGTSSAATAIDLTSWNSGRPAGYYGFGGLTFNASANTTILGSDGMLTIGGDITQGGSGAISNFAVAYDLGSTDRNFKGVGSGPVIFRIGSISSLAGVTVDAGYYVLSDVSGSFSSLTVNSGATLEISTPGASLNLAAAGNPSSMGTSQLLTNNGGTVVFNCADGGYIENLSGSNTRGMAFGATGGTAVFKQNVTGWDNNYGPLAFVFNNGTTPARIVSGAQWDTFALTDDYGLVLSTADTFGTGYAQMVLTNGGYALIRGRPAVIYGSLPTTNVFTQSPFTRLILQGQPNGDPNDTAQTSTSIGRFGTANWGDSWNATWHTNRGNIQRVPNGIFCQDVLHLFQRNSNPRFIGSDITVETGTTIFSGGLLTSSRTLNIGTGAHPGLTNTNLKIKDGATAVLNVQPWSHSGSAGVRLNADTIIEPGGTLSVKRSYTGRAGRPIVITGDIQGLGSGTKESVLSIDLPRAFEGIFGRVDPGYTDNATTFPGGNAGGGVLVDDWTLYENTTGVIFYENRANLVVNGADLLGLRVQGYSEYLTNVLTAPRLNALSGSGGVLTIAVTNSDIPFTVFSGPSLPSNVALGLDKRDSGNPTYVLNPDSTLANYAGLVLKGGTTVINDGAAVAMKSLNLAGISAALQLGAPGGSGAQASFGSSSAVSWAGGVLNILNWNGNVNGAGADRIYVGSTASGLTAAQLAKVSWIAPNGGANVTGAYQLSTGEIVPAQGQSRIDASSIVPPSGSTPFSATVNGAPGYTYRVLASSDLMLPVTSWQQVGSGSGTFTFQDPASLSSAARYYIVVTP